MGYMGKGGRKAMGKNKIVIFRHPKLGICIDVLSDDKYRREEGVTKKRIHEIVDEQFSNTD